MFDNLGPRGISQDRSFDSPADTSGLEGAAAALSRDKTSGAAVDQEKLLRIREMVIEETTASLVEDLGSRRDVRNHLATLMEVLGSGVQEGIEAYRKDPKVIAEIDVWAETSAAAEAQAEEAGGRVDDLPDAELSELVRVRNELSDLKEAQEIGETVASEIGCSPQEVAEGLLDESSKVFENFMRQSVGAIYLLHPEHSALNQVLNMLHLLSGVGAGMETLAEVVSELQEIVKNQFERRSPERKILEVMLAQLDESTLSQLNALSANERNLRIKEMRYEATRKVFSSKAEYLEHDKRCQEGSQADADCVGAALLKGGLLFAPLASVISDGGIKNFNKVFNPIMLEQVQAEAEQIFAIKA